MQGSRSGVDGADDLTVAQDNRVQFSHKVPSLKEIDTDVLVQAEHLMSYPAAMGTVRIRGGFALLMEMPATACTLACTVVVHVYDCGEVIGDETQRCEIVSGAAVHGRAAVSPQQAGNRLFIQKQRRGY